MPNVVLDRMLAERSELIDTIESVLAQVEGRDLTDAEQAVLNHTRDRINEVDAQIKPLEDYERVKSQHQATVAELPVPRPDNRGMMTPQMQSMGMERPAPMRRADGLDIMPHYATAGGFVVDYLRGAGIMVRGQPDHEAMARVAQSRAVANQTTSDTTGLLPLPIIGAVVNLIDARRPLITSLGGSKAMAGIPGATFTRPKITQHVTVGSQTAEKTQLPSQNMVITGIQFTKGTYGGTVDISRQDMDWTQPSAWDILIKDLADVYSVQTETAVAAAFKSTPTSTPVSVGTAGSPLTLANWASGLYTAAMHSYNVTKRMPDRIWCSLDVWASLGSLVDVQRVVIPVDTTAQLGAPGTQNLADFSGDLFGLPRIVVPTFASGTCIVGNSALFEVYEEIVGLLSLIEPSILGVTVAYGGYVAWGSLSTDGFIALDIVGVLPTLSEAQDKAGDKADKGNQSSTLPAGK
jgi:HK97 family phage major capsid protein